MGTAPAGARRRLAPEVVQTSGMDCGPAALACLLGGFGVDASYGRLREACQTDVDGTSIDRLEDLAAMLGLDAQQTMLSPELVIDPAAQALPAMTVTRLPSGFTHFVVVWRRHGRLVQVMDPAVGRRFVPADRFTADLYVHEHAMPADVWRAYAGSEGFLRVLSARLCRLGITAGDLIADAVADLGWRGLATLDAAVRITATMAGSRGLRRGREAHAVVAALVGQPALIPHDAWHVCEGGDGQLRVRGAVLVQVNGRRPEGPDPDVSRELQAALDESASRPLHDLLALVRADGALRPLALATAAAAAGVGVAIEAFVLRHLVAGGAVGPSTVAVVLGVVLALTAVELPLAAGALAAARRLEHRVRAAFDAKLGRLPDAYIRSRPASDMAERSHNLHRLRVAPELAAHVVRLAAAMIATAAGLGWLDPSTWWLAAGAAIAAVGIPLALQPPLKERDLRLRTHGGALSGLALDALLGLVAVRAHHAERILRTEHGRRVSEWAATARAFQRSVAAVEVAQLAIGFTLAAALMVTAAPRLAGGVDGLLFAFWALSLPMLGHELALALRAYPSVRSVVLRALEPLQAPEDARGDEDDDRDAVGGGFTRAPGVAIDIAGVTVLVAGNPVLRDVTVHLPPGSHTAVVGTSGAGKSTLLGLLLGWQRSAQGQVRVDGRPLTAGCLERLRHETAWLDPGVHLWNRSLGDNLRYGATARPSLGAVVAEARLDGVVAALPEGADTALGDGGALLSGGEAQRVRLGRALHRPDARLVVLDEPFRGLEREARRDLLRDVRRTWAGATLLCATHDVADALSFDRVLVIDGGEVVEAGPPADLAAQPGSRYRALLDADADVRAALAGTGWRRVRLEAGRTQDARRPATAGHGALR